MAWGPPGSPPRSTQAELSLRGPLTVPPCPSHAIYRSQRLTRVPARRGLVGRGLSLTPRATEAAPAWPAPHSVSESLGVGVGHPGGGSLLEEGSHPRTEQAKTACQSLRLAKRLPRGHQVVSSQPRNHRHSGRHGPPGALSPTPPGGDRQAEAQPARGADRRRHTASHWRSSSPGDLVHGHLMLPCDSSGKAEGAVEELPGRYS